MTYAYLSTATGPLYERLITELEGHIKNPDLTSEFGQMLSRLPQRPARDLISFLQGIGYDTLARIENDQVIGFIAFQRHPDKHVGVFRFYVAPAHRGNGVAVSTLQQLVTDEFARGCPFIRAGTHEASKAVVASFARNYQGPCAVQVNPDYTEIRRVEPSASSP